MFLPWGRLRGGTGGAMTLPTWAERKGRTSLVPLSRLQLLGAVRTEEGDKRRRGERRRSLLLNLYLNNTCWICFSLTFLCHREVRVTAGFTGTDHLMKQRSLKVCRLKQSGQRELIIYNEEMSNRKDKWNTDSGTGRGLFQHIASVRRTCPFSVMLGYMALLGLSLVGGSSISISLLCLYLSGRDGEPTANRK